MTVIGFFVQWHIKSDSQAADEILLLITIVNNAVHQFNSRLIFVEVKTNNKRKPFSVKGFGVMFAFNFDNNTDRAILFNDGAINSSYVFIFFRLNTIRCFGAVLIDANQLSLATYFNIVYF